MITAQNVANKAAVGFVAAAMIFSMFAPVAQAQQSTADLQKMINDLMKQVSALQGQGGTSNSPASGICPFTWTRDLKIGANGADVMKLQQFLNSDPETRVSASGAGSVGMETMVYGPATAAAVSKMQMKFRADILTPAGLVNPTGFFGPSTRAKANSLCVGAPVTGDDMDEDEDEDMTDEDEEDMDDEDMELSGEASLDLFEMEDGQEDEAEEGESDVAVGELTVEFTDGDAEISRIDLTVAGPSNSNAYDAFETISLWVDGEMVAELDASDESDYLDEDDGSIRFSGLNIVAMEDEELTIDIGVSVQNSVDGTEIGDWTITPNAVRFFDADGVATTEDDGGSVVEGSAAFEVVVEGDDEALDISLSSDSPDSANVAVDADSDTNDVTIMAMTLEAENNDVELNDLIVRVQTTGTTTTNVVDEAKLVIDGQTFKSKALLTTGGPAAAFAAGRSYNDGITAIWYFFDVDGDVVIDADAELDVEVVVDFNDTNDGANYATGQRIFAEVGNTELSFWDVEGANDITPDGGAVGETHTLVDEGLTFDVTKITALRTSGTGNTPKDSAEFEVQVEVTAIGDTFYIEDDALTAFDFTVLRNGTTTADVNATTTGTGISPTLGGSGVSKSGNRYRISDGQSEVFTFKVTVLPGGDPAAAFRVQFDDVDFFTAPTGGVAVTQAFIPSQDFRTNEVTIVN